MLGVGVARARVCLCVCVCSSVSLDENQWEYYKQKCRLRAARGVRECCVLAACDVRERETIFRMCVCVCCFAFLPRFSSSRIVAITSFSLTRSHSLSVAACCSVSMALARGELESRRYEANCREKMADCHARVSVRIP